MQLDSGNFCDACGRGIPDGESMWTVEVKEEVQEDRVTTVRDATVWVVYCRDCRGDFDFPRVSVPRIGARP